ncbi:MAG: Gliding motility regulatory protein [Candidatus Latescibacteria bacterium ADurb.Bin168]|nr:MAG: Gliding motility regulatory protein [Candidatus Latescibacteria bacterium ADurb.Bin168]
MRLEAQNGLVRFHKPYIFVNWSTLSPMTDRPRTPRVHAVARHKTILVVDDNPSMRAILAIWLNRFVHLPFRLRVLTARDGEEAWRILCVSRVDLLLANHHMPQTPGTQLIRRVKSSTRLRNVPCVLESIGELPGLAAEGLSCGADFVISLLNNDKSDLEFVLATALGVSPHMEIDLGRNPHESVLTPQWWATSWNSSPL